MLKGCTDIYSSMPLFHLSQTLSEAGHLLLITYKLGPNCLSHEKFAIPDLGILITLVSKGLLLWNVVAQNCHFIDIFHRKFSIHIQIICEALMSFGTSNFELRLFEMEFQIINIIRWLRK